jgi:hypothetical protein
MPSRPRTRQSGLTNPRAEASRSWCASLIRKRAQVLADVQARNREAAEAAARCGSEAGGKAAFNLEAVLDGDVRRFRSFLSPPGGFGLHPALR